MFCTECGFNNSESGAFCKGCGKALTEGPALQNNPPAWAQQRGGGNANPDFIPDGVKGFSWGALLFNWVWAIGNRTWIGLLALIPWLGFVVAIWLGFKGREMAWKNKQWENLEHFNRVQKQWSQWAVGITISILVVGVLAAIAIPGFRDYKSRGEAVRSKAESSEVEPSTYASTSSAQAEDSPDLSKMITREKFNRMLVGKSSAEVIQLMGAPDATTELVGDKTWSYEQRTYDPVTGKPDNMAMLTFSGDWVVSSSFL